MVQRISTQTKLTVIIIIAVFVGAVGFLAWQSNRPRVAYANIEEFAQCLSDKGATMYGAVWCPHCQNQKRLFGDAFSKVPYVECPENPSACTAAGIAGYPTWIMGDGRRFEGETPLTSLSDATGCPLVAK